MQQTCVLWLSATVLVFLSVYIIPANSAKCRGRWAIHACYGGNGKRSGQPTDLSRNEDNKGFFLKQLLSRTNDAEDDLNLNDIDSVYPTDLQSNVDMDLPYESEDGARQQLQRLSDLVQKYLYRKKLRQLAGNDDYV